jgi:hypothetical protein
MIELQFQQPPAKLGACGAAVEKAGVCTRGFGKRWIVSRVQIRSGTVCDDLFLSNRDDFAHLQDVIKRQGLPIAATEVASNGEGNKEFLAILQL